MMENIPYGSSKLDFTQHNLISSIFHLSIEELLHTIPV